MRTSTANRSHKKPRFDLSYFGALSSQKQTLLNNLIASNRNLDFSVAGSFTNQRAFEAPGSLTVSAGGNIDNHDSSYAGNLPPVFNAAGNKNQVRLLTNQAWGTGAINTPVVVAPTNNVGRRQ